MLRAAGDFGWRHSVSYGSFKGGDVGGIAGALISIGFPGVGAAVTVASILFGNSYIYYTSTYSQKRENGVLYVKQNWKFYRNSTRTSYITQYTINRQYSNNGGD